MFVVMLRKETDLNLGIRGGNLRRLRRLTFNLAGLIYYGAFVRRNLFLAECLVRESLGYMAQGIQVLKSGEREDPSLQASKA